MTSDEVKHLVLKLEKEKKAAAESFSGMLSSVRALCSHREADGSSSVHVFSLGLVRFCPGCGKLWETT